MTNPMFEGDCVRHSADKFVGFHVGYTRLSALMERSGDIRGVRVQLPDGSIRIASEFNLQKVETEVYDQYSVSLGIAPKGRRRATTPARI